MARNAPDVAFTTLAHHMDVELLRAAYERTRKDGAVGVDGQTAAEYAKDLEANLQSLLDRAKSGRYRAPPVRRVHIPKGTGGETRPLGIPTFEDKVLQRGVVMLLEPIYEQDFMDCSYGFRPKRSAHQAIADLWDCVTIMRGCWILEVDIRKFFDMIDHAHLREIVSYRMRDGVIKRLIGKWLNAGVLENGSLSHPESGTPQGGVISPLLANIYLHEVLDKWFAAEVCPRLLGKAKLIRYADDFVIAFEQESDAHRVLEVLHKRFEKYGLTLHPTKTRLIDFRRPQGAPASDHEPSSFDLLGFTHYWGRAAKNGKPVVKRKTAKSRFRRAIVAIRQWCRQMRHAPVAWQHEKLAQKARGHYGYYGITGNFSSLHKFWNLMKRVWGRWLARRSQRTSKRGDWFTRLLKRYPIPPPRIVRSVYRVANA